MGMSLFLISNSGQINHQIKVPRSCCRSFLSQGKRTISSWTGSSKKWLWWQGIWTGESRCKCIFREERGTWSHGVAMPGLSEEPGVVQDGWSIASMKNGKNHWKGRLRPWYTHGTARHWTGYLPKTKWLPLRSLQL